MCATEKKITAKDAGFEEGHVSHRKDGDYKKEGGEWHKITRERVSRGLKKTSEISDYIEGKLKARGVDVDVSYSNLSDSRYITLNGVGEKFGKDNDDEVVIRVSNHDLPATYNMTHHSDYDVRSGGVNRAGANGEAIEYYDMLEEVLEWLGPPKPKEKIKDVPDWTKSKVGVERKLAQVKKDNYDAWIILNSAWNSSEYKINKLQNIIKQWKEGLEKEKDIVT